MYWFSPGLPQSNRHIFVKHRKNWDTDNERLQRRLSLPCLTNNNLTTASHINWNIRPRSPWDLDCWDWTFPKIQLALKSSMDLMNTLQLIETEEEGDVTPANSITGNEIESNSEFKVFFKWIRKTKGESPHILNVTRYEYCTVRVRNLWHNGEWSISALTQQSIVNWYIIIRRKV